MWTGKTLGFGSLNTVAKDLEANFEFNFQNTSNVQKKMHPIQAHSAKPKDLHFLRLKFVSAFSCHVRACAFVPQAVRFPARYGSTWRHCHPKIREFPRENWLNRIHKGTDCSWLFIFLPKGWWQIHRFTWNKKSLTTKRLSIRSVSIGYEKRVSFTQKMGVFLPRDALKNPSHLPKKRTKIYGCQSLFARRRPWGILATFCGGIRPF